MHNIYLTFTKHRESGLCTSNELIKIIENIKPDVIFEEVAPSRFAAYYKEQSVSTLETNSIKKYLETHKIKNIPVDKDVDMPEIIDNYKKYSYLNDYFFHSSIDYCKLWEKNVQMSDQYGFKYFNSTAHTEISDNLHKMERLLIRRSQSDKLDSLYNM